LPRKEYEKRAGKRGREVEEVTSPPSLLRSSGGSQRFPIQRGGGKLLANFEVEGSRIHVLLVHVRRRRTQERGGED